MIETSIDKIYTTNYKNLTSGHVSLHNLNILIGPNGSGKSNFIALLRFLRNCGQESSLEPARGRTHFEDAVYTLGGTNILDGALSEPANVGIQYIFQEQICFSLSLLVQSQRHQVVIDNEYLAQQRGTGSLHQPSYYYQAHNQASGHGSVAIILKRPAIQQVIRHEDISNVPVDELALLNIPRLLEQSKFSPEQTPVLGVRRRLLDTVQSWMFYNANNMHLENMRRAEPKLGPADEFISSSGENLALVLYNLVQADFEFETRINQLIKDILPQSRKIRAVASGRLSLTVEWHVEDATHPFYLDEMSDGTVRMLCWAIILNSPKLPSLIVIDEPELGIHVAWLSKLAAWIKNAAEKTQVIVSTHSPDLLDHFTDQLDDGNVLVFEAEKDRPQHFEINRLDKLRIAPWLQEGWQLGDLYRVGNPDVGGWPW